MIFCPRCLIINPETVKGTYQEETTLVLGDGRFIEKGDPIDVCAVCKLPLAELADPVGKKP